MIIFSILSIFFHRSQCDTWAVLLAGIYEWDQGSYAAEAAIYQTYYQLVENGVSREHIIVFCMNTSAYSEHNPYPGEVYEHEGGENVYPNIKDHMDYVNEENTWENFVKVLRGEDMKGIGTERTLKTSNTDNVLIVTANHGNVGYINFYYANRRRESFFSADIVQTVKYMQAKKKFKRLAWFMGACYSGSNFNKLFSDDDNVYIMTAGTPERVSYWCEYSEKLETHMTMCLHRNWLAFARARAKRQMLNSSTLYEQYLASYANKLTEPTSIVVEGFQINFIEEYCNYGNVEDAKVVTLNTFLADKYQYHPNNVVIRDVDDGEKKKKRILSVIPGAVGHGGLIKRRSNKHTTSVSVPLPLSRRRKRLKSPSSSAKTVVDVVIFDADAALCYAHPKLNTTCMKQLAGQLLEWDPSEKCNWDHFDYMRLVCSEVYHDVEEELELLKHECPK